MCFSYTDSRCLSISGPVLLVGSISSLLSARRPVVLACVLFSLQIALLRQPLFPHHNHPHTPIYWCIRFFRFRSRIAALSLRAPLPPSRRRGKFVRAYPGVASPSHAASSIRKVALFFLLDLLYRSSTLASSIRKVALFFLLGLLYRSSTLASSLSRLAQPFPSSSNSLIGIRRRSTASSLSRLALFPRPCVLLSEARPSFLSANSFIGVCLSLHLRLPLGSSPSFSSSVSFTGVPLSLHRVFH
jgi:hypothetical protein